MKPGILTSEFYVVVAGFVSTYLSNRFGGDKQSWLTAMSAVITGFYGIVYIWSRFKLKLNK